MADYYGADFYSKGTAKNPKGPEILAPRPVRGHEQLGPVRAVPGKHIPGSALGQRLCFAALDGHLIDVPQKVKSQTLAVGGDIHADPRAFGGLELKSFGGTPPFVHDPFIIIVSSQGEGRT